MKETAITGISSFVTFVAFCLNAFIIYLLIYIIKQSQRVSKKSAESSALLSSN
jgi:hypothetical protein